MINVFNTTTHNTQLHSFTRGTMRRIQRQNDVKKEFMSQATCLAWYQSTNFTHRLFFCLIILLFAVNLIVSSMSLSLVINFGCSNYKRQFFDVCYNEIKKPVYKSVRECRYLSIRKLETLHVNCAWLALSSRVGSLIDSPQ